MGDERVVLAHGGGGILTRVLLSETILPALGTSPHRLPDASAVPGEAGLMITTDAFVVKPLFFRGGDIGSLSVHGTLNDLAVAGARPLALTMTLVLEEGLSLDILERVVESAGDAAQACGVRIVAGDTKVVARGEADQLFITTAGVGRRIPNLDLRGLRDGDRVLISGPIADHGIAVMSQREGIDFETSVLSDSAPIYPFVEALTAAGVHVHAMRDPTRGGLAAVCAEFAHDYGLSIALHEADIPIRPGTAAACAILGLDPLTVANEGKLVAFVAAEDAERALGVIRSVPGGEQAAAIGAVTARRTIPVTLRTRFGGQRLVEMPYGEDLPRIC